MKGLIKKLKIKMINSEVRLSFILCFALCILFLTSLLGCYSAELVNIKVKVDSKVDMKKYNTIAVIDFFNRKGKPAEDQGKIIARMIRKQLKNNRDFQILDEKDTILDEDIDSDVIENPDALTSICSQLGIDALIIGSYDLSQRVQPVPYIVERYSAQTGKYTPEGRTYIQKVYYLKFHASLVDGTTGKIIFDYSPLPTEKPEYRSSLLPFSDGTSDPAVLRSMAVKSVTNFVLNFIPHYTTERRLLVK